MLFTLGGTWLDGKAETQPLFTILGVMLGFVGGSISLVYQVQGPSKRAKKKKLNE